MDKTTTIEELRELVVKFCKERDWGQFHNPKDTAIKISVEASELLEKFEWLDHEEVKALFKDKEKRQDIEDELADVFYNILLFSHKNDIDLSTAFKSKLKKIAEKYPIDKAKGSKKKYTDL